MVAVAVAAAVAAAAGAQKDPVGSACRAVLRAAVRGPPSAGF